MRILGIDPGPTYFAWAIYDDATECLDGHGMVNLSVAVVWPDLSRVDAVACERISPRGHVVGNSTIQTAETCGAIRTIVTLSGKPIVFLARPTIASVVTGSAKSGDKEVNLAIQRLVRNCPMPHTQGFQGHHRSALAIAYVGVGRIRALEIKALA